MIKYSNLKNIIKKIYKEIDNELMAYISHYLQNINFDEAHLFSEQIPKKIKYMLDAEPIEWDVPFPPKQDTIFTFIDLFAGIGGMRTAFQNLGGKCVFSSEWDKYAQKTYEKNFGEVPFGDITKIDENRIPSHDILVAGFPCQAFSIAGKRGGFEDTRGTLFFNVAKILKAKRPRALFLENVKGLLNHDRGRTIQVILNTLRHDLGYYVPEPQIINAKDFGVPQNRERVFIVGFREDMGIDYFEYPKATGLQSSITDIMEKDPVSVKYYLSTQYLKTLVEHKARHKFKGNGFGFEIVPLDGIANAIVVGGMGRERNLIVDDRLIDFTPVTNIKGEVNREGIRRMTPREWARLQGFTDEFLIKVSDAQAYKQFGNSVAVPAVQATGQVLVEMLYGGLEGDGEKKMITGNKGEWSELYVLLKLLGDGVLYGADAELNRLEQVFYPIIKIIRQETNQAPKEYHVGPRIRIVNANNNSLFLECDVDEFINKAQLLLQRIQQANTRSFSIPEIERFMGLIRCTAIKAKSEDKRDITMMVHDMTTNMTPVLGFSIKSKLGGASTLFNANRTSNFIFEITGIDLSEQEINRINAIDSRAKIRSRLQEITSAGGSLIFAGVEGEIFGQNLELIDTGLPQILAYIVRKYYEGYGVNMVQLISILEDDNPLGFNTANNHPFYLYKIKKMLTDMALGMTSAEVWDGSYDANGGYIVVREDGEILCYHVYNKNEFENYLILNTKLDTPSSSRHNFGKILQQDNRSYIKLGLQIRF